MTVSSNQPGTGFTRYIASRTENRVVSKRFLFKYHNLSHHNHFDFGPLSEAVLSVVIAKEVGFSSYQENL